MDYLHLVTGRFNFMFYMDFAEQKTELKLMVRAEGIEPPRMVIFNYRSTVELRPHLLYSY